MPGLYHLSLPRFQTLSKPLRWVLATAVSLAMIPLAAVVALEQVDYTSGNSFTFNIASGHPNQDFGTVHIESDSSNGWVLYVRSLNNGTMKRSGSNNTIPYILEVNGITINNLSSGNNEIVYDASNLTCDAPGCDWNVRATIAAVDLEGTAAGNYSDTLTFTLSNR